MINAPTYEGHDIDGIKIGGEWFVGIGYQGLLNVNTKTYVEEPTRSNDGSIPNINDHDTFIVPRCKVNFKYFKIEDYQKLLRVINSANEFPVIFLISNLENGFRIICIASQKKCIRFLILECQCWVSLTTRFRL